MDVALGEIFSGVFSVSHDYSITICISRVLTLHQTSESLWDELHVAGENEHDRFWRMPLDEEYGPQIYSSNADLQNVSRPRSFSV